MDVEPAEKKFWKMPELIESLLFFLDPSSTFHLAQARAMDKQILRGSLSSKVWKNFIKQSTFGGDEHQDLMKGQREEAQLQKVFLPPGSCFLRRNFPNIEEEFS